MQRLFRTLRLARFVLETKSLQKNPIKYSFATSNAQTEQFRFSDSFMNGSNAEYLEALFDKWQDDNNSVPAQWDAYFKQVSQTGQFQFQEAPTLPVEFTISQSSEQQASFQEYIMKCFQVRILINRYREKGHEKADIDPLHLESSISQIGKAQARSKFSYEHMGFNNEDLNREFHIFDKSSRGITSHGRKTWKLAELIGYLEKVYRGKIGYEYCHLQSWEQRAWIRDRIENYEEFKPKKEQQLLTFERLCKQYCFSTFLDKKFNTSKRFGIDGLDSMVSGLLKLVDTAADQKVEQIVVGMAHRGRLETLYTVFQKSAEEIMVEFQDLKGKYDEEVWGNSGDVKYHLGCSNNYDYNGHQVRVEILPNPSHLEAVNPLVYGKTKAIQDILQDKEGNKALGILIHGDAAISGQGIVYESFQFGDLNNYKSGGLIHIVSNNQIGFTTTPKESRSGLYCTDIAYTVDAPVFHVNGDEPDIVDQVFQLATEFRNKFHKDVVIDIVGYRRFGHNELDQPSFTQPIMYSKIKSNPPVFEKYSARLVANGVVTQEQVDQLKKKHYDSLEEAYKKSRQQQFVQDEQKLVEWEKIIVPNRWGAVKDTGVPLNELKEIAKKINHIDENFNVHPQVKKFYEQRLKSVLEDTGIDFATAEALAFGSLLDEGYGIRLSGQDVGRATFSHRHAAILDQVDPQKAKLFPLKNILPAGQEHKLTVQNSHLSEFGVLGFEYGYSLTNPNTLCLWEAQFGDFANGAQVMIDNYITSAETKWGVESGITLLLPNGMDGQGPEHSSGRVERFLQLSDDDPMIYEKDHNVRPKRQIQNTNIQVVQPTTPRNYFHVLRRQLRRQFRKPLVVMTSKRLLRYVPANSSLKEFDLNTRFNTAYPEIYPEELVPPQQIQKVAICSGQIYYDLLKKRQEVQDKTIAIIRIEQLAPFPYVYVQKILEQYSNARFFWVQEEHQNYGPWYYVRPRLNKVLHVISEENKPIEHSQIHYIGRRPSASTATGFLKQHEKELGKILMHFLE